MQRFRIENIEVIPDQREAFRDGEPLHLRRKVFDVLLYLVRHRDRVIDREELVREVWKGANVAENSLSQCVIELRKALGDDAQQQRLLKTVARSGYRFVGPVEVLSEPPVVPEIVPPAPPVPRRFPWGRGVLWGLPAVIGASILCGVLFGAILTPRISLKSPKSDSPIEPETPWFEAAWWKLDEGQGAKATDLIRGLSAALPPGVKWVPGITGAGLQFSGAEVTLRGDGKGVLPVSDKPRTLLGWARTESTNGDWTPLLIAGDFGIGIAENGVAAFGAPKLMLLDKDKMVDGRWRQIAGVYEGPASRRLKLYVNGELRADGAAPAPPRPLTQWAIGTGINLGTTIRGSVDDVRFFERALRPDEIRGLYRCMNGAEDVAIAGSGPYYFAPISGDHVEFLAPRPGDESTGARNTGKDYGGFMVVKRAPGCSLASVHGADLGQDLNVEIDLHVPFGPNGAVTDAGPYFRSRRANPGDGIAGGASAGFWVRLESTGQVTIRRLSPYAVIGLRAAPPKFDANAFHRMTLAAHGNGLQVSLDGKLLTFEVGDTPETVVPIVPQWETLTPKGENGGSVGVQFSCSRNRGQAGGQEARNLRVLPYRALDR